MKQVKLKNLPSVFLYTYKVPIDRFCVLCGKRSYRTSIVEFRHYPSVCLPCAIKELEAGYKTLFKLAEVNYDTYRIGQLIPKKHIER